MERKRRNVSAVAREIVGYTALPKDGGVEIGRAAPDTKSWTVKLHGARSHEPWLSAWHRNAVRWIRGWSDTRSLPDRENAVAMLRFAGAHAIDFGRGPELLGAETNA